MGGCGFNSIDSGYRRLERSFNNNNNNNNNNNCYYYYYYYYYYYCLLQLGCHPVAVVILHVNKT